MFFLNKLKKHLDETNIRLPNTDHKGEPKHICTSSAALSVRGNLRLIESINCAVQLTNLNMCTNYELFPGNP